MAAVLVGSPICLSSHQLDETFIVLKEDVSLSNPLARKVDTAVWLHPRRDERITVVLRKIPYLSQIPVGTDDGRRFCFQFHKPVNQADVFLVLEEFRMGIVSSVFGRNTPGDAEGLAKMSNFLDALQRFGRYHRMKADLEAIEGRQGCAVFDVLDDLFSNARDSEHNVVDAFRKGMKTDDQMVNEYSLRNDPVR